MKRDCDFPTKDENSLAWVQPLPCNWHPEEGGFPDLHVSDEDALKDKTADDIESDKYNMVERSSGNKILGGGTLC